MKIWKILIVAMLLIPMQAVGETSGVRGDLNGNGELDFGDFVQFSKGIQSGATSCDLDGDGKVNAKDFALFARLYGSGQSGSALSASKLAPGKEGVADLTLRESGSERVTPSVTVGDTLEVELYMEAQGESVTQVEAILSFDDAYLEIIPAFTSGSIIRPFTTGGFLSGQIIVNDTQSDIIGDSNINQIPLFQLHYSELIAHFQGTPQRFAAGNGVVARFKVRVTGVPPEGSTPIRVDIFSPTGSETGYYIVSDPGSVYNYRSVTPLVVSIHSDSVAPILDLSTLESSITLTLGERVPVDLQVAVVSGNLDQIVWDATSTEGRISAFLDGPSLVLLGNRPGMDTLTLNATDFATGVTSAAEIGVEVLVKEQTPHQAFVTAVVTGERMEVPSVRVEFGRSISGKPVRYDWEGPTDAFGAAHIQIEVLRAAIPVDVLTEETSFITASILSSNNFLPGTLAVDGIMQIELAGPEGVRQGSIFVPANLYFTGRQLVRELNNSIQASTDLDGYVVAFARNYVLQIRSTSEAPGFQIEASDVTIGIGASLGLVGAGNSSVVATSATSLNDLTNVSAELDEGDILNISGVRVDETEFEGEFSFYDGATVQDLLDEIAFSFSDNTTMSLDTEGKMALFDSSGEQVDGFELEIELQDSNETSRLNSLSKRRGGDLPQQWRVGASGYYRARAVDEFTGEILWTWGSIPISGGKENTVTLPVGKPAINQ